MVTSFFIRGQQDSSQRDRTEVNVSEELKSQNTEEILRWKTTCTTA